MSNNQSHPIAEVLTTTLIEALESEADLQQTVDLLLKTLDREKLLYYSDPGRLPILNNHGRVLVAILEDPGVTQRALSVYLRVSESNVQGSLKKLLKDGIIVKQKVGNRNTYSFDYQSGFSHPDVRRILECLVPRYSEWQAKR
jgi:predicted HTH transcriptional regulator